jgi:hypothetical protein
LNCIGKVAFFLVERKEKKENSPFLTIFIDKASELAAKYATGLWFRLQMNYENISFPMHYISKVKKLNYAVLL